MTSNREFMKARYSGLYGTAPCERSESGWPLCLYCGDPADQIDHVPPITRVDDYRAMHSGSEKYYRVKACKPCNEMLSNSLQHDIIERIDEAKRILRKKLGRRDVVYLWADEDLLTLGKNLRSKIASDMRKTESLVRRIEYRGGLRAVLGMLNDRGEK